VGRKVLTPAPLPLISLLIGSTNWFEL